MICFTNPLRCLRCTCAAQPTFISAFGLSKDDVPTLVAFHPKKLRGAALKGAYSSQSIDALLDGLFSGSIHSAAFQVLLKTLTIIHGVADFLVADLEVLCTSVTPGGPGV